MIDEKIAVIYVNFPMQFYLNKIFGTKKVWNFFYFYKNVMFYNTNNH